MNENLEKEKKEANIVPVNSFELTDGFPLSDSNISDLKIISQSLAERAKSSNSLGEIKNIIDLFEGIENTKERRIRQDIVKLKIQNEQKQTEFNRQLELRKENAKIFASIGSVGFGLYLFISSTNPLLAPLFIILGLAGNLQYSLNDIGELWKAMTQSTNDMLETLKPKNDKRN